MRKVLALLLLGLVWASAALPRAGLPSLNPFLGGCNSSYVGPGDVVPGFALFWGFRGYNRAAALGQIAALQLKRASDSATKDIHVLCSGAIDAVTETAFCLSTTCTITKFYDQTAGGANPTVVATNQAPLGCSGTCAETFPTNAQYVSTSNIAVSAIPYSIYMRMIPANYGGFGSHTTFTRLTNGANQQFYGNNGSFNMADSAGNINQSFPGITWIVGVFNGTLASSFYTFTGGGGTSGAGLTASLTASQLQWMGETGNPSASGAGAFYEIAPFAGALTSGQITSLGANAVAFWGG